MNPYNTQSLKRIGAISLLALTLGVGIPLTRYLLKEDVRYTDLLNCVKRRSAGLTFNHYESPVFTREGILDILKTTENENIIKLIEGKEINHCSISFSDKTGAYTNLWRDYQFNIFFSEKDLETYLRITESRYPSKLGRSFIRSTTPGNL